MSEPSPEAKFSQVKGVDLRPTYEELEAIAAERIDTIMELREAINTATAKYKGMLESAEGDVRRFSGEATKAKKGVTDLNNLLRAAGWGQGEIDSAATVVEECEAQTAKLREELDELQDLKEFWEKRAERAESKLAHQQPSGDADINAEGIRRFQAELAHQQPSEITTNEQAYRDGTLSHTGTGEKARPVPR